MSNEIMVQDTTPSKTPYTLGGAAVGGAGAWALAKYADVGIPKQRYTSLADIVEEATQKDSYYSTTIEKLENMKDGDKKTAWTTLKEKVEGLKTSVENGNKEINKAFGEVKIGETLVAETAEGKAYIDALRKREDVFAEILEKAKGKTDKVTINGSENALSEIKDLETLTKDELKAVAEKLGIKDAEETCGKKVDDALKALRDKAGKTGKGKKQAEKITNEIVTDVKKAVKGQKEKISEGLKDAEKTITSDFLKKIKAPAMGWTIAAGAAALGIIGALIAPKNKNTQA